MQQKKDMINYLPYILLNRLRLELYEDNIFINFSINVTNIITT